MNTLAFRLLLSLGLALLGLGLWKLVSLAVLARARGRARQHLIEGFSIGKPGILVFGSLSCPTCVHAQEPAARKAALALGPASQLIEVDVDNSPELAKRYGVISLPTVFILDAAGDPKRVYHGFVPEAELKAQLRALIPG